MPAEGITAVECTEDHAFGIYRGALLYVWRRRATAESCRVWRRVMYEASRRPRIAPGVVLGIVEATSPPPDLEVRNELVQLVADNVNGYIRAGAVVYEGDGFRAAMVRGVTTGLQLLSRHAYPQTVCSSVAAGASFLVAELQRQGHASCAQAELVYAMELLRAHPPLAVRSW